MVASPRPARLTTIVIAGRVFAWARARKGNVRDSPMFVSSIPPAARRPQPREARWRVVRAVPGWGDGEMPLQAARAVAALAVAPGARVAEGEYRPVELLEQAERPRTDVRKHPRATGRSVTSPPPSPRMASATTRTAQGAGAPWQTVPVELGKSRPVLAGRWCASKTVPKGRSA